MNEDKIYVDVNATFTKDGMLFPKSFVWEDGVEYEISNVGASGQGASELPALVMGLRRLISLSLASTNVACW